MSALENVQAALAAISAHADLNAFLVVHERSSLQRAAELDAREGRGGRTGALYGMPVALKDNIDEAGVVGSAGCAAYADRIPERDAAVVQRLSAAGAVSIGRTNMHELADGVTSENPHFGPVHNPRRRGYHPGGSSGGSAAAVASGCVPLALGTDTGGSVRIPASLCGVTGFKPTAGLLPTDGVVPLSTTLDHVGLIARTAEECAHALGVLAGDRALVDARAGAPGRLRIGVLSGFGLEADPEVGILFEEALGVLQGLGHRFQPVHLPDLSRSLGVFAKIYAPEAARAHAHRLSRCPEKFGDRVRADLERGLAMEEAEYERAIEDRDALTTALDRILAGVDLLATPATPHPARPIGSPSPHTYLSFTCPFNLAGLPAVSVPMGEVDGLPVGLQLAGRRGEDALVLAAATAFGRTFS